MKLLFGAIVVIMSAFMLTPASGNESTIQVAANALSERDARDPSVLVYNEDDSSRSQGYGACCVDGVCEEDMVPDFICVEYFGGEWHPGMLCDDQPCDVGACCFPANTQGECCRDSISDIDCYNAGGVFYGDDSSCSISDTPLCNVSCQPETIHVCGSCQFTSIQDAINAAYTGDTVYIHAGVYYEKNIRGSGKDIHILGETSNCGALVTTINGQWDGSTQDALFYFINDDAGSISNLILTGGDRQGGGAAIYLGDTTIELSNLLITRNSGTADAPVAGTSANLLCWDCNSSIINCVSTDNGGEPDWPQGQQIKILGDGLLYIKDTIVCGNFGTVGVDGNWFDGGGNIFAEDCTVNYDPYYWVDDCFSHACCLPTGCLTVVGQLVQCENAGGVWIDDGCDSCVAPPETCDADLDSDGDVDIHDLLVFIAAWGVCP